MDNHAIYNEKELLNLVGTGCEQAFTTIFKHHRNKIYSIAFRLTHCPIAAEEIVHDVFLQIWLKREDLLNIENFNAYLFVVARNNAYKVLKQIAKNYESHHLMDAVDPGAEEEIINKLGEKQYSLLLKNGIDQLPRQQEKVFRLIMEEGLKRKQVADLLQLKPETIKYHLAEAMKNLRAFCNLHLDLFVMVTTFLFISRK